MNSSLECMITTIVQEFSGKEFTKEDLVKIYKKTHPTTNNYDEVAQAQKKLIAALAMSPLEYAEGMQDDRSKSPVWKDIYKKKEHCEKIKSVDIESYKKWISTLEDDLRKAKKRAKEREKERKKFNALTNKERDTLQEARNKKEKATILRRFNLK